MDNITASHYNDSPTLETLIEEQQEELLSLGLRVSLSSAMACVCIGSVFGGFAVERDIYCIIFARFLFLKQQECWVVF